MRKLITLALLVVCVAALPATAQSRRRSARSTPPAAAPPAGDCHTFGLVQAGLSARYLSTTPSGNVTFTINYISDTPTQLRTTQKVITPQATTDVETRVDGEVSGNLRGIKHIYTKATTAVPVLGSIVTEVDVDFVPALIAGPAEGWCVGAKWTVPPSTETIVAKTVAGTQTQVVTTVASEGEVLAVGETITVPGGTFRTVKYRGVLVGGNNSVQPAITWVSMEHNIVVKQDTLDASGAVTSVTELQGM